MKKADDALRILIVDDDPGILATMEDVLLEKSFGVAVASDGFQAIEMVKQNSFDTIIMDMRMPGMDGVEVFKKMKACKQGTRAIFMTGHALEELVREAKSEGAIAVLLKPIDIDFLVSLLKPDNPTKRVMNTGISC